MNDKEIRSEGKQPYEAPKVLATYQKEELEETIKPHGPDGAYTDGISDSCPGCGCGCGA